MSQLAPIAFSSMPPVLPSNIAALAEVLASGRVQPIGGNVTHQVDVRFIACSSLSLRQRVRDGLFREDLLARIGIAEVALPPLRDRRVDIPSLARHFLARFRCIFCVWRAFRCWALSLPNLPP